MKLFQRLWGERGGGRISTIGRVLAESLERKRGSGEGETSSLRIDLSIYRKKKKGEREWKLIAFLKAAEKKIESEGNNFVVGVGSKLEEKNEPVRKKTE